jgi:hypothetical protein
VNHAAFKPIPNTLLPHGFCYIRLERARDRVHHEGDDKIAYIMIVPLDAESRIDTELYRKHRETCRVVRRRLDNEDSLGHLVHEPGGSWRFHYDLQALRRTKPAAISTPTDLNPASMSPLTRPTD